jgi:hypothetical protein
VPYRRDRPLPLARSVLGGRVMTFKDDELMALSVMQTLPYNLTQLNTTGANAWYSMDANHESRALRLYRR